MNTIALYDKCEYTAFAVGNEPAGNGNAERKGKQMKIKILKGKGKKAVIVKTLNIFSADMAAEQATLWIARNGGKDRDILNWDWA